MRRIAIVVLTGLLVFAGCGGDDDDSSSADAVGSSSQTTVASGPTSPADRFRAEDGAECPLLDAETVNEKMGHGLEMKVTLAFAQGCEFTATSDSAITASISEQEDAEYERVKSGPRAAPLSGVGDEAFTTNHGVWLTHDSKHYSVEVFDLNSRVLQDEDAASIALELAKAFVAAN